MGAEERTVHALVEMVRLGELRLPEMQRQYVWTAAKVRDLFDSLYRGYPSGVILVWEPSEAEDVALRDRDFAVDVASSRGRRSLLLLDGQQRLTSLSAVMRGEPVHVKWRKRPIELLFNLDHPDELMSVMEVDSEDAIDEEELSIGEKLRRRAFIVGTNKLAAQPHWVKVSSIFSNESSIDLLEDKGFEIAALDRETRRKYTSRLDAVRAIKNYKYRMEILERDKSYREVTEIFVRVNSLGARLKSSDLALAQITATWRGSLEIFTHYEKQTHERRFSLDLGVILRTLLALTTGQARFSRMGSLTLPVLQSGWERTKKALDFAHNFLVNDLGIESPVVLTSPLFVATVAYWADIREYRIEEAEKIAFRKWLLIANAKGRYSRGSSETLLEQDFHELRGVGVPGLNQRLVNQVGRLDFTEEELIDRRPQSGAFKTFLLALRAEGAEDWKTKLLISAKHQGESDAVEYHHIFPDAYLKSVRPDLNESARNDIANLAIVGGSTNRHISKKAPSLYRHDFAPDVLATHLVDFSDGLDQPENFEAFVVQRRAAMAATLNKFLGATSISDE